MCCSPLQVDTIEFRMAKRNRIVGWALAHARQAGRLRYLD